MEDGLLARAMEERKGEERCLKRGYSTYALICAGQLFLPVVITLISGESS